MSILEEASALPSAPIVWTRLARARVGTLTAAHDGLRRAVIVGSAGSGKSRLLRHIGHALTRGGVSTVQASSCPDLSAVDPSEVVLVDDAHLLSPSALAMIGERILTPDAGVILACRPWPRPTALAEITRSLEQAHPAIVLGHVTREDVRAHVHDAGGTISDACVQDILQWSGAVTWIVAEALSVHDGARCDDAGHRAIRDALRDVIVHRLRSLDPAVRAGIELLCLGAEGHAPSAGEGADVADAAQSEGLLLHNGEPVPVVRDAVRGTISLARLIEHYGAAPGSPDTAHLDPLLSGVTDPRVAAALLRGGKAALSTNPARAAQLLRSARESGAPASETALLQARAAWSLGEIDTASAFLDEAASGGDAPTPGAAVELAAAIWAARGLMDTSAAVYRAAAAQTSAQTAAQSDAAQHTGTTATAHAGTSAGTGAGAGAGAVTTAHAGTTAAAAAGISAGAAMVALAVADREALLHAGTGGPARTMPSTLGVATGLLERGIRTTLTGSSDDALNDLVRASEMYTVAGGDAPTPELPAVVAAQLAINLGDLDVARSVLDDAVRGRQGGAWAHDRLLLWRAWVAVQQERPHEAEASLQSASAHALSPRDRLLADAIVVALARRYSDAAGLTAAWRRARESLLRARFDVFSIHPLGEFVVTAARVGEPERMESHFTHVLSLMQRLDSPPAWAPHLHWTGIQRGILLNRPEDLKPHARALVAASRQSPVAAMMAQAGRVWTSVLAGSVDAETIEVAAYGLASVGLAWDGARLAGHGAGRTQDRRVISRLLACARQLHPREEAAPMSPEESTSTAPSPRAGDVLSTREREVALLVLQGKTYAEIGETIFISPRTAEHHIARIRVRLGATTRSDLIAKLRQVLGDAADLHEPARQRGGSP